VDVCAAGFWGCKYQKAVLMLKCLMLMRLHTVAHRYHHFTDGLNGRIKGSMNNVLEVEMGSFTPLVFSKFLVVWVMLVQYFTKELPSLFLSGEGFHIVR